MKYKTVAAHLEKHEVAVIDGIKKEIEGKALVGQKISFRLLFFYLVDFYLKHKKEGKSE